VEVTHCLLLQSGELIGTATCTADDLRRLASEIETHGSAATSGGRRVWVEMIRPVARAIICGAGHIAQALASVVEDAGFRTVVLDDRPEFACAERFPGVTTLVVLDGFGDAFKRVVPDVNSYVVIVTRGHRHDFDVLTQALQTPASYIGLMSSRSKWEYFQTALRDAGFSAANIARVRAPVGLAIGAETPAELAISIAAEMIQWRSERS
jgi:xanthine dehydrogenase accessory factor